MALSFDEFQRVWKESGEDQSELVLDVAWRRYQQIQADDYVTHPEQDEPSLEELEAAFKPILDSGHLTCKYQFITLPASNIPWTPTGIYIQREQAVSVFATGRTWRSRLLDLYLPPKVNLWFRIGVNGSIFNSTHDTKTFLSMDEQGDQELFIANQFPGSFSDKEGGRVGSNLSIYDKAEGSFQILIAVWQPGLSIHVDIRGAFQRLLRPDDQAKPIYDPFGLMSIGMERLSSKYLINEYPRDWTLLWFLGQSQIFYQELDPVTSEDCAAKHELEPVPEGTDIDNEAINPDPSSSVSVSVPMIRCLPTHNVGILQKDIFPPLPLTPHTTTSWSWLMIDIPSRLREDTTLSHDYFSLAFEFENGRDLTYTWSWELPVGFGYWCPLAAWCDREYHIVLRSGTEELGKWVDERRNIYRDYVEFVNGGEVQRGVPKQIVKVWLIAGNRWQRLRGEMLIKRVRLFDDRLESVDALVVL